MSKRCGINLENFKELDHQQKFDFFAEYLENDRVLRSSSAGKVKAIPIEEHIDYVKEMWHMMKSDFEYTISEEHHLTALHNLQLESVWSGKYARCSESVSKSMQTKLVSKAENLQLNFKVLKKGQKPPVSRSPATHPPASRPSGSQNRRSGSGSHPSTTTVTPIDDGAPFSGSISTYQADSLSAATLSASNLSANHISASALSASTLNFSGIKFSGLAISGLNVPSPSISNLEASRLDIANLSCSEIVASNVIVSEFNNVV
ncbi:uncharacterized protein LOC141646374 [Silene latifolia]|uniref:uncharacterized protein LOC141646374 n=1 Tax=Silene latifolia TaxID=37657 RepID=UPI003D786128